MCVFGLGLRLRPAALGWGVGMCVCLCARSACTPPLLAGVCSLGVCVCTLVWAAPHHSWLGCSGVPVFMCALCLDACHSWPGRAVRVCVLGLGFRLRPATPGWGVGPGVCLCACSACTLPLLAGVCGVGVCAWALVLAAPRQSWLGCRTVCVFVCALRLYSAVLAGVCDVGGRAPAQVSAAPRHSLLGCWDVCVFVCAPRLYPATPGWVVPCGCGCVCLRSGFGCARHSWLECWGVFEFVCALRLYHTTPSWGVRCGCVCLSSAFGCASQLLAGVLGCVCVCCCARSACAPPLLAGVLVCLCVCVRSPLIPRHSWLACAVWVCVLGLGFRLRPATPGWGVEVCVCVCERSACTPPLLAGVCGVGVCVWARVLTAPRHSWPILLGCVCVSVFVLSLCPPTPGWGVQCVGLVPPGTRSCAPCGLCALLGFAAPPGRCCLARVLVPWLRPAAGLSGRPHGRALVRHASSGPVALGAPVGCPNAELPFPRPGGLRPRIYWATAWGTWSPAENQALCACPWPLPRQRRWARSAPYLFGAPRWGFLWQVLPASVSGCGRCGGLPVWTRSLTRPVFPAVRLSTGDSAGALGLFTVDADTAPVGSEDATPGSRACVCVQAPLGRVGRGGLPGAFWWMIMHD